LCCVEQEPNNTNAHVKLNKYINRKVFLKGTWIAGVILTGIMMDGAPDPAVSRAVYDQQVTWMMKNVKFRTGDLVFRRGKSVESQAVLLTDRNSGYSHVGILFLSGAKPFVIHAVPPGPGNEEGLIRCESLGSFLSFEKSTRAAVYRVPGIGEKTLERIVQWGRRSFDERLKFDDEYDLTTDHKLYCTELIWKCYRSAGIDLVRGRFDNLSLPLKHGRFILPGCLIRGHVLMKIHSL
jgi:hypothetical protein